MWKDVPLDIVALIKGEVLAMLIAKNNINLVNGKLLFNGQRVSYLQDEKSSADGWCWGLHNNVNVFNTTVLKNDLDGKFYVICILSQLKIIF